MNRDFAEHLDTLFTCRLCPNVLGQPVTGFVENARVMLVGQAPGPREMDERRPFAYTAGKRLFSWFAPFIAEDEFRRRVYIAAMIRCFPGRDTKAGGDRVPDAMEIANCAAHLDREIALLRPELIIAVGTLASKNLLGIAELKDAVGRVLKLARAGHTCDVVVLPHPSGRSTWTNKPENRKLLEKSLALIARRLRLMAENARERLERRRLGGWPGGVPPPRCPETRRRDGAGPAGDDAGAPGGGRDVLRPGSAR